MYYPYLQMREMEMLALMDATQFLTAEVVPILNPYKFNDTNKQRIRDVTAWGHRVAIITNAAGRGPTPTPSSVQKLLANLPIRTALPALEIRTRTSIATVGQFAKTFTGRSCIVVHRDTRFTYPQLSSALSPLGDRAVHVVHPGGAITEIVRRLPNRGVVLLMDGFNRERYANSEFPPRSGFHNGLHAFPLDGYDGFGDFTIVKGDVYRPGGRAAKAVALHLTEITSNEIVTNHFVSDPPHVTGRVRQQYPTAATKLFGYVKGKGYVRHDGRSSLPRPGESEPSNRSNKELGHPSPSRTHAQGLDRPLTCSDGDRWRRRSDVFVRASSRGWTLPKQDYSAASRWPLRSLLGSAVPGPSVPAGIGGTIAFSAP